MFQKVTLIGRLPRDMELRSTQSGSQLGSFSMACSENRKQKDDTYKEHTEWFSCVIWGKRSENLAPHMKKGTVVHVEGKVSQTESNGKRYFNINVDHLSLLSKSKPQQESSQNGGEPYQGPSKDELNQMF